MHTSHKTPLFWSVSLFLILSIFGCSTMELKTFHDPEMSFYKELSQIPGLQVYIEPMLNDSETKKYFGTDLIKKNILAVYISMWNTKSSKSFLILEDSIKITQLGKAGINNRPEKDSEIEAYTAMGAEITTDVAGMVLVATALSVSYPTSLLSGFLVVAPIADVALPLFVSKKFSDASVIKKILKS